jgi:hypothetical protein
MDNGLVTNIVQIKTTFIAFTQITVYPQVSAVGPKLLIIKLKLLKYIDLIQCSAQE